MSKQLVIRNLKCEFTVDEMKKFALEMAQAIHVRDSATDDLKAVKSQYDSKIKGAEAAMKEAGTKLRTGYEYRNVECELEEDHIKGTIQIVRLDTGEIVDIVKMSGKHQLPVIVEDEITDNGN